MFNAVFVLPAEKATVRVLLEAAVCGPAVEQRAQDSREHSGRDFIAYKSAVGSYAPRHLVSVWVECPSQEFVAKPDEELAAAAT